RPGTARVTAGAVRGPTGPRALPERRARCAWPASRRPRRPPPESWTRRGGCRPEPPRFRCSRRPPPPGPSRCGLLSLLIELGLVVREVVPERIRRELRADDHVPVLVHAGDVRSHITDSQLFLLLLEGIWPTPSARSSSDRISVALRPASSRCSAAILPWSSTRTRSAS